ncbi:MAG: alpha-L-fucosidase, partial [Muribaculaceae bacterium]|nr:alpha-L-fucosidase [Muribaculaceae bacterium]
LTGVVFCKKLNADMQKALVWDVEKGVLDKTLDTPWQTCTCLGNWHYDRGVYNEDRYKSAKTVVGMLIDIVSKNGNLLLSVPVRGYGTIDEKEEKILSEIKGWLDVNGEGIFGTRPWENTYGEGPSTLESKPLDGPGFNENRSTPYTAEDIRFTTKDGCLYAHVMEWPENNQILIRSLKGFDVRNVKLLGGKSLHYSKTSEGLLVRLPHSKRPNEISPTLKVTL